MMGYMLQGLMPLFDFILNDGLYVAVDDAIIRLYT